MPQEIGNERRFVGPVDRAKLEAEIASAIGQVMSDNDTGKDLVFTWDEDKSTIIVERYSELGNVIEFYEVRPIVSYIGDGRYDG